ncbi:MAG TPA: YbhN family protein [Trebonia sp.]|nr:YbhN family protein [Trebonia sp.]
MGSSGNVQESDGGPGADPGGPRGWVRGWRGWLPFLAKPLRRGVLLFILVLVIEYLVVPELVGASKDLYLLGRINAGWISAGVILEGLSLFCYAVLTRVLLPGKGPKPSLSVLFRIDLSAAAVAHVIPAGTLGTAALGYKLFTDEGISGNDATVMMAAKGIGSTVVLNVLLWLSLVVSIPLAGFQPIYGTVAIIGTVVLLGVAALVLGVTRGAGLASRLLRTIGDKLPFVSGVQVERAALEAARSFSLLARDKRVMAWALLWASLNWLLDAASLWCFVAAFGHLANPIELFAAYGIANVAGALPLTPGGLGVVDSITPLLLVGFGVTRSVATLGVLGWRMVNFWLPIPTGALAYASLKVKPNSGMRAMRAALPGLFNGRGEPDVVGDMPEGPALEGASPDGAGSDGVGSDGSRNGDSAGGPTGSAGSAGDSDAESPAEERSG